MAKIGYAPQWTDAHAEALEEYQRRKDDPAFVSPKFTNAEDALEWLDEA